MQVVRTTLRTFLYPHTSPTKCLPVAGLKSFAPPPAFGEIEYPERSRLRVIERSPRYPTGTRIFKMQKKLRLMRGPEPYHNTLLHKQYGIIATGGGRLKYGHFEMIRMTLLRNFNRIGLKDNVFAVWRIDPPWQPVTKKSSGQRMGGGKGAVDHYVTPVKAGRVIVEIGGHCQYFEVKYILKDIAAKLPFKAMAVSQDLMEKMVEDKRRAVEDNQHLWTWKYMIQNNMLGCHRWISPFDKLWFNEHK